MTVLIQNVSPQCIPNLVAVRTFRPSKLIWVCTPECENILADLQRQTLADVPLQQVWRVDARDAEALHIRFQSCFTSLSGDLPVIYHLTGGTKSMALQGLYNLGIFRRATGAAVQGVVMDPRSQYFDLLYPQPKNNVHRCVSLSLTEMLAVHGNKLDAKHPHDPMEQCARSRELWNVIHAESEKLKQEWSANRMRALHPNNPIQDEFRHFQYNGEMPRSFRRMLNLLQEHGWLSQLSFPASDQVRYRQRCGDVIKLINGGWLEHWLGAVLFDAGIDWCGGGVSIKVLERSGGSQEFDFLGATAANRLVYWSCKTDKKLGNDKLFEVDALRDGIAGADFHVAGLLHTAPMSPVMQAKALRMRVHTVNAREPDAKERLVRISGG